YRRKEIGGQRYTYHCKYRYYVIRNRILLGGTYNAQRYCYQKLKYRRNNGYGKRYPHVLGDDLSDGFFVFERPSQIPFEHVAQPIEISFDYATERIVGKSVHFLETVYIFLTDTAGVQLFGVLVVYVVGRHH